jgi:serine/threonine-protein kinase
MTAPERWARIERILDELLDATGAERVARLEALTGDDAALQDEVRAFLEEDEREGGPLDRGVDTLAHAAVTEDVGTARPPARRVGPYRVIGELGRGGMGEVLLAERADGQFEHRVALKIVRGAPREDVVERFRHERQILARLRHPNIASLHDGGSTDDGLPYFAMEYVDGDRITAWCDARRLDVDARLALFDAVCRAVQYAHRNLVVHRDLKPGNVLVTSDGTVKLLDFGIAKLVDPGEGDDTHTTRSFFTPAYASPEQIRGLPTSTATDVWSLGVLLFELLTGRHPHGGDTRPSMELARSIVEDDAPSASAAWLATASATREELARNRATDPAALRRRLRGDLDNILHKALRRNPEERYASVEDLRMDLERYRKSLPVSARSATAGYRLRKLVRRHRLGAAAVAVAALAVVAGVVGVGWQARVAAQERDRARAEARRAGAVKDYLLEVFSAADPTLESGRPVTAVDLAERGASRIESRFADDPEVRADITSTLGHVLLSLAEYDRADTLLRAGLEDYRRLDRPEGIVTTLTEQGELAVARAQHDRAVELFEEAKGLATRTLGPDDRVTGRIWSSLGGARLYQGKHAEAESAMGEALRIARALPDSALVSDYLQNLAASQNDRGDRVAAEASFREALAVRRALNSEGDVYTARILTSLCNLLNETDRLKEAEETGREAVALFRREYGERGHPEEAISFSNLAGVLRKAGNLDEAEALQLEALDMFKRHLGEEHYWVARLYSNLSLTRMKRGDIAGAEKLLSDSIRLMTNQLGPRHRSLIAPLNNRAKVLTDMKRYEEAEALYQQSLSIAKEVLGERSVDGTYALAGLGSICRKTGRLAEAERYYRICLDDRRAAMPAGQSPVLSAMVGLGGVLIARGRVDEGRKLLEEAVAAAQPGLPATQKVVEDAQTELARSSR